MSQTSIGCSVDGFDVGVAAEHDDPVGVGDHGIGELLGVLVGDVDADLQERLGGQGVDLVAGRGARGAPAREVTPKVSIATAMASSKFAGGGEPQRAAVSSRKPRPVG